MNMNLKNNNLKTNVKGNEKFDINQNSDEIDSESYKFLSTCYGSSTNSYGLTSEKEDRESSNSSELLILNGQEIKTSKKNNKSVSQQIIEHQIINNCIVAEKDRVKIKRNVINYIISDYFACAESIINNSNESKDYKERVNKILTQLKEIIKNNSCIYKIGFLISSNDIKNKILKILIEKIILKSFGCNDTFEFYNKLFQSLPEQFYSFNERLENLKTLLENKFGENEVTKEFKNIPIKTNSISNPWEEKATTSILKVCKNLQNNLLENKRKSIFRISKDYTENIRQKEIINYSYTSYTDLSLQESKLSFDANDYESFKFNKVSDSYFDNFEQNLSYSSIFDTDRFSTCANSSNEEFYFFKD